MGRQASSVSAAPPATRRFSGGSLESFPFLSMSSNISAPGELVIMEARSSPWMDQHRTPPLPTAMAWDRNGELCREEMGRVMSQLEVPPQEMAPEAGLHQQELEFAGRRSR